MTAAGALILGFGNEILGDDAVGVRAAAAVGAELGLPVETGSMYGFALLPRLAGHRRLFVIDALESDDGEPGAVRILDKRAALGCRHLASPHTTTFFSGLEFGRFSGLDLPAVAAVYGIVIRPVREFSAALSPELAATLPAACRRIVADISARLTGRQPGP